MIDFQPEIPILPATADRTVGRVAAVRNDPWSADICDEFRRRGYDVLALPAYRHVPAHLQRRAEVHLAFSAALARRIRELGGIDYLLAPNGDGIVLLEDAGRLRTLGDALGVPTIAWWFDDPRLGIHALVELGILLVYPFLTMLRSAGIHHYMLDRAMAAEFGRGGFFPHVRHLPVATSAARFHPPAGVVGRDQALVMVGNGYSGAGARDYTETNLDVAVHDELLVPLSELKRTRPRCDFRTLLGQWVAGDPARRRHHVVRAMEDPWHPARFNTAYHTWKANTFLWCELRNQAVRHCQQRFGPAFRLFGRHWDSLGVTSEGYLAGTHEHRAWYHRSRVGLTCNHGQLQTGLPFRIWELAASGIPIVTQDCAELPDYFKPGEQCAVFGDPPEAPEVVERLLADQAWRRTLAERALGRCRAEHLWEHRVQTIVDDLDMPSAAGRNVAASVPSGSIAPVVGSA